MQRIMTTHELFRKSKYLGWTQTRPATVFEVQAKILQQATLSFNGENTTRRPLLSPSRAIFPRSDLSGAARRLSLCPQHPQVNSARVLPVPAPSSDHHRHLLPRNRTSSSRRKTTRRERLIFESCQHHRCLPPGLGSSSCRELHRCASSCSPASVSACVSVGDTMPRGPRCLPPPPHLFSSCAPGGYSPFDDGCLSFPSSLSWPERQQALSVHEKRPREFGGGKYCRSNQNTPCAEAGLVVIVPRRTGCRLASV